MKAKLLDLIKKGISSFTSKRWRQPQHDCKIGTECLKSLFLIRSIRFIAVKRARFHTAGSISVRNYPEINLLPHAGKCFFRGSPQNANICSLALTTHALRASGERITNTVIHPLLPSCSYTALHIGWCKSNAFCWAGSHHLNSISILDSPRLHQLLFHRSGVWVWK